MDQALKLLFSRRKVGKRVRALARELNAVYGRGPVTALCVLKGAVFFYADLVRLLDAQVAVEFARASSYGDDTESCGAVDLDMAGQEAFAGKRVLVVEDIVDTGLTLAVILDRLRELGAAEVRVCALVDKTGRRQVEVPVHHAGFRIERGFVVGCGMDHAGRFRTVGGLYEIVDSSAQ